MVDTTPDVRLMEITPASTSGSYTPSALGDAVYTKSSWSGLHLMVLLSAASHTAPRSAPGSAPTHVSLIATSRVGGKVGG